MSITSTQITQGPLYVAQGSEDEELKAAVRKITTELLKDRQKRLASIDLRWYFGVPEAFTGSYPSTDTKRTNRAHINLIGAVS